MRPSSFKIIGKTGTQAFIISDLTNVRYMTGLDISHGCILVTTRSMVLFTDGRYAEMARKNLKGGIVVKDMEDMQRSMKRVRRCGFESNDVTVGRLHRWKRSFVGTSFIRTKDAMSWFRRSKDENETKYLKQALRMTETMLKRMHFALHRGVTEKECAWKLQQWAHELGADGMAFDPIVAFGENTSRPHHRPTTRRLKKGDMVLVDTGAKYNGYCADRTAMYFTGEKTSHQATALEAIRQAKHAATLLAKPGASVRAIDRAARGILATFGMEDAFIHSLGHGVGLDIHEGVTLSHKGPNEHLLKSEVITIEPGVYFPGKFGIRLEDMIFV